MIIYVCRRIICNNLHVHLLLMTLQRYGSTPLFAAACNRHDTIVAALLSHPGVDVNKATVCTMTSSPINIACWWYHC